MKVILFAFVLLHSSVGFAGDGSAVGMSANFLPESPLDNTELVIDADSYRRLNLRLSLHHSTMVPGYDVEAFKLNSQIVTENNLIVRPEVSLTKSP